MVGRLMFSEPVGSSLTLAYRVNWMNRPVMTSRRGASGGADVRSTLCTILTYCLPHLGMHVWWRHELHTLPQSLSVAPTSVLATPGLQASRRECGAQRRITDLLE